MKVLMVEPGKAPYETELDGSLKSMQAAVGGDIEGYYPYEEPVVIVCNDEGKINGLPLNRTIYGRNGERMDTIAGPFFIAGLGEDGLTDLPDYLREQYKEQFKYPERFFQLNGKIVAVKQPLPTEKRTQPKPVTEVSKAEEKRLDVSIDLAFDLDEFLRQNSDAYAELYPDVHTEKERMVDELVSGNTGKVRMRLASFEQEEHLDDKTGSLLERISSYEKEYEISAYSIYQLSPSGNTSQYYFMPYDWLEKKGISVDRDNYRMAYAAQWEPGETLEDIYRRFNIDHPKDFKGHSLSVSDVVVLHENGTDTACYVDSFGFKELPDFFRAGVPEEKREVSMREQLDCAKKRAAQTAAKTPDKKPREAERS